jgi:hypothetical protein
MSEVPASMTVGDLEFNKFQNDADDCVAVNVVGATKNADGKDTITELDRHFIAQTEILECMRDDLKEMLEHLREITGLNNC